MVRDLILDINEGDLLFTNKSDKSDPVFDSFWGNVFDDDKANDILICNIIIPKAYWSMMQYVNNELILHFKSEYHPDINNFHIRPLALNDGQYSVFEGITGDFGMSAYSYATNKNIATQFSASLLPYIDIDGEYLVKMVKSNKSNIFDRAYIYSSKNTDINIDYSDDQASQLLSLCDAGKNYRYPTIGVGITRYINSVISHSDLEKVLDEQFNLDNKQLRNAEFDNTTGKLSVIYSPENETEDTGLDDISQLDTDFFKLFNDTYVRRNIVISNINEGDFLSVIKNYGKIINIVIFTDENTTLTRIGQAYTAGKFDSSGNIVESDEYYIVSETIEADNIIMFDDELFDEITDSPIFTIDDIDTTRLYSSLVEQSYWITEKCHKCLILRHKSVLKYMIKQEQFASGKGLFIVSKTSDNIKNMLGIVQDENTGRISAIVSNATNISDVTLDEISQHIYANK